MKFQLITDQPYVTIPVKDLMKIQEILNSCSLLMMLLSRSDINDEYIKNQYNEVLKSFSQYHESDINNQHSEDNSENIIKFPMR